MGNPLLQIIGPDARFDINEVASILEDTPGIVVLERLKGFKGEDTLFAEFRKGDRSTALRLFGDHAHVSIDDWGALGLDLALEIHRRYQSRHGRPLYVFDQQYTFMQRLDTVADVEQLLRAIAEDPKAGAKDFEGA